MNVTLEIDLPKPDALADACDCAAKCGATAVALGLRDAAHISPVLASVARVQAAAPAAFPRIAEIGLPPGPWLRDPDALRALIRSSPPPTARPPSASHAQSSHAQAPSHAQPVQWIVPLDDLSPTSADALAVVADTLQAVRHDAEAAGARLALADSTGRLSPLDAFALLDQANSPAVGWRFEPCRLRARADAGAAKAIRPITDLANEWVETLAGLIFSVRLALPPQPAETHALEPVQLIAALGRTRYDGTLVIAPAGDPAEALRRAAAWTNQPRDAT